MSFGFVEWVLLIAAPFVGSFLGVLALRLPEKENFVTSRSRCPTCHEKLKPLDLVPILSWIWHRGKCRYCHAPISLFYPAIEIATFFIALWALLVTDGAAQIITVFLGWWLLALAIIDYRTLTLPDPLTLPLIPLGLGSVYFLNPGQLTDALIGSVAGFVLMWVISLSYKAIRSRDGLGFGDVKLMAAAGAWVGWIGLSGVLFWGVIGGLFYILISKVFRENFDSKTKIPFGTFLCLGLLLTWLYGPVIPL